MRDDSTNISFQNKRTDNPSFISNPVLIPHGSVRIRNQNNKHNNLHFIKVEDNLSVQPKNIYKITSLNKDCLLELHHMQVQRNLTMKSMYNRRQSFKTNNKRLSKKELRKRFGYFKCFNGVNTKQVNYYIVPTLVDKTPQTVVIYIGSNDITKMNYKTTNVQNPAQRITDIGLKCKSYGVSRIAILSILPRSSAQLNQVIGKVNDLLKSLYVTNGFIYISNEMIHHKNVMERWYPSN